MQQRIQAHGDTLLRRQPPSPHDCQTPKHLGGSPFKSGLENGFEKRRFLGLKKPLKLRFCVLLLFLVKFYTDHI